MTLDLAMISHMTPKEQETKAEIDKRDYIKLKVACASQDTISRLKGQQERIFANNMDDKGLISSSIKNSHSSMKKKKKLDQEMGKGLEDISPKMIYKRPANIRKDYQHH